MDKIHYYSANSYYKKKYEEKVYRLSIDGGMTCPNRDGRVGFGGCTFCSERGSGDFTPLCDSTSYSSPSSYIQKQLTAAQKLVESKAGGKFIAYFQSYTNTYAKINYLNECYRVALTPSHIVGLSIATRPDCINIDIISLLLKLKKEYKKDIYIELGLQTANDKVAEAFNRGYTYPVFEAALRLLNEAGIPVIVHMILGLPKESPEDIYRSIKTVSALNIHGIKLSLLHIIKGTAMEKEYLDFPERFYIMDEQVYIETLCHCIELIPKNIVIYRITGDGPKSLLVAPEFTSNKKAVLNSINAYMNNKNIIQGRLSEHTASETNTH